MLRPDIQWQNPVMFVVEVGAALTLAFILRAVFGGGTGPFSLAILWRSTLGCGSRCCSPISPLPVPRSAARAGRRLCAALASTPAQRLALMADDTEEVASIQLKPGDRGRRHRRELIPGDGEVVDGIASVDESAITGESAPVIRESGGDRSGVTGGTMVLSDRIVVRSSGYGETFLDRMIALVEGAVRQRTPNEIALALVLTAFSLIFLIVVVPLWPMA